MGLISKISGTTSHRNEGDNPMLRYATYADLAAVFDIIQASASNELQKSMFTRTYVDQLNQERHKLGVYEQDGKVIGFVNIRCTWQLHLGTRVGELKELVVAEGHRNGTVRDELLQWAEDRAREAGCESIAVTSRLEHPGSHEFYESNGFTKSHYRFDKPIEL